MWESVRNGIENLCCMSSVDYQLLIMVEDVLLVVIVNFVGVFLFFLIGDYVGKVVFVWFGLFGLDDVEFGCYIGWDIGIGEVGVWLLVMFDVVFICQIYLWFVVDCNCSFG